jgi:hypothetical protein
MRVRQPAKKRRVAPRVVRDTPDIFQALGAHSEAVGVSTSEVLRQIVAHYNAKPWRLKEKATRGVKSARWGYYANHFDERDALTVFQKHATKHGVSWAEALRQCVRKHLADQGRASQ